MDDLELRRCVDAALSEVGYPDVLKPPSPGSPKGTRFCIARGTVPIEATHKALMLALLRDRGASAPSRCVHHARAWDVGKCPMYPVGALLAGVITGCDVPADVAREVG